MSFVIFIIPILSLIPPGGSDQVAVWGWVSCCSGLNHGSNTGQSTIEKWEIWGWQGLTAKKIKSGYDQAEYLHKVFSGLDN